MTVEQIGILFGILTVILGVIVKMVTISNKVKELDEDMKKGDEKFDAIQLSITSIEKLLVALKGDQKATLAEFKTSIITSITKFNAGGTDHGE